MTETTLPSGVLLGISPTAVYLDALYSGVDHWTPAVRDALMRLSQASAARRAPRRTKMIVFSSPDDSTTLYSVRYSTRAERDELLAALRAADEGNPAPALEIVDDWLAGLPENSVWRFDRWHELSVIVPTDAFIPVNTIWRAVSDLPYAPRALRMKQVRSWLLDGCHAGLFETPDQGRTFRRRLTDVLPEDALSTYTLQERVSARI